MKMGQPFLLGAFKKSSPPYEGGVWPQPSSAEQRSWYSGIKRAARTSVEMGLMGPCQVSFSTNNTMALTTQLCEREPVNLVPDFDKPGATM